MPKINTYELLKYWFDFYLCPIFSESNMSIFLDPFGEFLFGSFSKMMLRVPPILISNLNEI